MALNKDQFAEQLRHHRKLRGLNQADVAHKVGVELRTYQRWEAGERMPYNRHVLSLAHALDVDMEVFTGSLNTSDTLLRIEADLAENNRLLRQLLAQIYATTAQPAAADLAPGGALGRIAEGSRPNAQDPRRDQTQRERGTSASTG